MVGLSLTEAHRIAANIAKLSVLLRKPLFVALRRRFCFSKFESSYNLNSRPIEARFACGVESCSTISVRKSASAYSTRWIVHGKLPLKVTICVHHFYAFRVLKLRASQRTVPNTIPPMIHKRAMGNNNAAQAAKPSP